MPKSMLLHIGEKKEDERKKIKRNVWKGEWREGRRETEERKEGRIVREKREGE